MQIHSLSQERIHFILGVCCRWPHDVPRRRQGGNHSIFEVARYQGIGVQSPPHYDLVGCSIRRTGIRFHARSKSTVVVPDQAPVFGEAAPGGYPPFGWWGNSPTPPPPPKSRTKTPPPCSAVNLNKII